MAIDSRPFGRTVLTGRDADKFLEEMLHGKPDPAAIANVKAGIERAREMRAKGRVHLKVRAPSE